jgi:hypothetical protein
VFEFNRASGYQAILIAACQNQEGAREMNFCQGRQERQEQLKNFLFLASLSFLAVQSVRRELQPKQHRLAWNPQWNCSLTLLSRTTKLFARFELNF